MKLVALKELWKSQGLEIQAGASPAKLSFFGGASEKKLPDDLRQFYQAIDGMHPDDMDEQMLRFWQFHELQELHLFAPQYYLDGAAYAPGGVFLVFADFLMHSHFYGVQLRSLGSSRCSRIVPLW